MNQPATDTKRWHKRHPFLFAIVVALLPIALASIAAERFGSWAHVLTLTQSLGLWSVAPVTISRWLYVLLFSGVLLLLIVVLLVLGVATFSHGAAMPAHLPYTQDNFLNLVWRWRWANHGPADCQPFCPVCDLQIVPVFDSGSIMGGTSSVSYSCNQCQKTWHVATYTNPSQVQHDVSLLVERNVRQAQFNPSKTP
jgi:hypothetical protein